MSAADALLSYQGARGRNFFEEDAALKRALEAERQDFPRLSAFGALCGGELGRLIEAAHAPRRLPTLRSFDAAGNRIEGVDYCVEQKTARSLMAKAVFEPRPAGFMTRIALSYLANQNGEGGITCPLAMTDGLIQLLEERGTDEQKRRCLPMLRSVDGETALPGGQFVTERQGGSNVAANETTARPLPGGDWALTGLKWFCSNPSEVWATTAKLEGSQTVGLFLVCRRLPDGSLNDQHILRLKEISGTRGKATAEVEYRGTRAELIGRPGQGLVLLARRLLWVSRIHVAAAALGYMRRASWEAELFAQARQAYGRAIARIPYVARELEEMRRERSACLTAFFRAMRLVESGDAAQDVLVPLLKLELSGRATAMVRRARLVIGGHAALEDFTILPRLAEDALVNEIWEGTHPILGEHAAKALRRPASMRAFLAALPEGAESLKAELSARVEKSRTMSEEERSLDNLELCAFAFRAFVAF